MSLQYGPEAVVMLEVINILDSTWIQKCCVIAAFGLVLCDHTSTLIREVELIWGRRLTSVTILFYLNRWIIVAWALLDIVIGFVPLTTLPSCAGLNYLGNIFDLILLTIWSAFSGIRIYAVTQGSLPLAMTVSLLNMVPVGTNAYEDFFGTKYVISTVPVIGEMCGSLFHVTEATNTKLEIITRVTMITADVIILIVTWQKTYATYRRAKQLRLDAPMTMLLLRDGTLHFMLLLAINIINIAGETSNIFNFAAAFTIPITSGIISHFLLNLRQVACGSRNDSVESRPSFVRSRGSSIRFNSSFIDNMGDSLDYGLNHSDPESMLKMERIPDVYAYAGANENFGGVLNDDATSHPANMVIAKIPGEASDIAME